MGGDYTHLNQNQPCVSFLKRKSSNELFIYLWLHWVFFAMCRLFLVVTSKGYPVVAMFGLFVADTSLVEEHGSRAWPQ